MGLDAHTKKISVAVPLTGHCDHKGTKVRGRLFLVASEQDLLRLKRIARTRRSSPGYAEDIAFLEARRRTSE